MPMPSSNQTNQAGSNVTPAQPPRRRIIDQILAARQQAGQNINMLRLGGSSYMDMLDQMRQNPMNSFY
jgi:hypothetical protein